MTNQIERLVMLPVSSTTGEIDYCYVEYDLQTIKATQHEGFELIDGWEFKPFKLVPAT
jgi:hypothetical protein